MAGRYKDGVVYCKCKNREGCAAKADIYIRFAIVIQKLRKQTLLRSHYHSGYKYSRNRRGKENGMLRKLVH